MKRSAFAVLLAAGMVAMPIWAQTDSTSAHNQEPAKKAEPRPAANADKAAQGQPPEMDAGMQAWLEASTPGKHHQLLEQFVGEWDAEVVMMMPGGHAEKSTGFMTSALEFDGRYLRSRFKGSMFGMPFKGESLWGYNNIDGRYESAWIDSLGTGIYVSRGSVDETGKVFTFQGEHTDVVTRRTVRQREVITVLSPDRYTMEFFGTPEGTDERIMIITYTRRAPADAGGKQEANPGKQND